LTVRRASSPSTGARVNVPDTSPIPETLTRAPVEGLDARRTVNLYGVAGRERTAVASAVVRLLRGADWRQIAEKGARA